MPSIIIEDDFINLEEEKEEGEAMIKLASFFDKVWARLDSEEPSIDDYYDYI